MPPLGPELKSAEGGVVEEEEEKVTGGEVVEHSRRRGERGVGASTGIASVSYWGVGEICCCCCCRPRLRSR